jgi:hypothetical protein
MRDQEVVAWKWKEQQNNQTINGRNQIGAMEKSVSVTQETLMSESICFFKRKIIPSIRNTCTSHQSNYRR